MTFSIIIPAYNAAAYLSRCLDSIFSQDYTDHEVIVINDGSTDGTASLLKDYIANHSNLQIVSQTNQGISTARNQGINVAQGNYVMFVDSDDELMPHALSTLATQLDNTDIVSFGTKIHDEQTNTNTDFHLSPLTSHLPSGWDYFNHERLTHRPVHFVCIWQRVYRRAFLEEHKLRFADGLRRAEDDLFTTMSFLHAGSVKRINDILYIYHVRPDSITRSSDPKLDADSWHVQQILTDTFIPMQDIDKTAIYQVIASNYINHLAIKGNTLSHADWQHFHEVCITSRHRRLYRIAHINPSLLRLYNRLCSLHR